MKNVFWFPQYFCRALSATLTRAKRMCLSRSGYDAHDGPCSTNGLKKLITGITATGARHVRMEAKVVPRLKRAE